MNNHIFVTIISIAIGTIVILIAAAFFFTRTIYTSVFCRIETKMPFIRTPDEFSGLNIQICPFSSDKGQTLAGYLYSKAGIKPLGIIIIAHGFGFGGQCAYMDTAERTSSRDRPAESVTQSSMPACSILWMNTANSVQRHAI